MLWLAKNVGLGKGVKSVQNTNQNKIIKNKDGGLIPAYWPIIIQP